MRGMSKGEEGALQLFVLELLADGDLERYPSIDDPDASYGAPEEPPCSREDMLRKAYPWLRGEDGDAYELHAGECEFAGGRTRLSVLVRAPQTFPALVLADGEKVTLIAGEQGTIFEGAVYPYYLISDRAVPITGQIAQELLQDTPADVATPLELQQFLFGTICERIVAYIVDLDFRSNLKGMRSDQIRSAAVAVLAHVDLTAVDPEDLAVLAREVLREIEFMELEQHAKGGYND